jgi:hypothetical protein
MTNFEFNVPVPERKKGVVGSDKHGVVNFPIGGSIFFQNIKANKIYSCVVQKNPGGKFTSRNVTEDGIKGVRIWRLS